MKRLLFPVGVLVCLVICLVSVVAACGDAQFDKGFAREQKSFKGKRIYAFGDSIVFGHTMPQDSFVKIISETNCMNLSQMAVNGATVLSDTGNDIMTQLENAPNEEPDYIVFDGYTNDIVQKNINNRIGEIIQNEFQNFDKTTFCGSFENILLFMQHKWPNAKIVYMTIHKNYDRDWAVQSKLRELALAICKKWRIEVADIFGSTELDTRNEEMRLKYLIEGSGSHPNRLGYEVFYIPEVERALHRVEGN